MMTPNALNTHANRGDHPTALLPMKRVSLQAYAMALVRTMHGVCSDVRFAQPHPRSTGGPCLNLAHLLLRRHCSISGGFMGLSGRAPIRRSGRPAAQVEEGWAG